MTVTWKTVAIAAVAGVALGGGVGYFARPQPAVHRELDVHDQAVAATDRQELKREEASDREWTFYGPGAGAETPVLPAAPATPGARVVASARPARTNPCPVLATLREHVGPITTDLREKKVEAEDHQVRDRLTITPASRPGWAFQVGTEDLFSLNSVRMAEELRLATRRRLFGPAWAEVSTKPLRRCDDRRWCPTAGVALSLEW